MPSKLLFDRRQEGDILLDGEAADEAEDEVAVAGIPIAMCRREGFGVDAACHQVAGPAGGAFEQGAEFRVGCEEDTRLLVVEGGGPQRGGFDLTADARAAGAEETCEPSGAGGCVFMHIGVPGGDQRHTKAVGDPCADEAQLRGSGDVDDVGAEAAGVREDARQMPPVREVETQVLLYGE